MTDEQRENRLSELAAQAATDDGRVIVEALRMLWNELNELNHGVAMLIDQAEAGGDGISE